MPDMNRPPRDWKYIILFVGGFALFSGLIVSTLAGERYQPSTVPWMRVVLSFLPAEVAESSESTAEIFGWSLTIIMGFGLILGALAHRAFRPRRTRQRHVTGDLSCPHCGSLQIDTAPRFADDGSEYEVMHCFPCERDFEAPGQSRPDDPT